MSEHRDDQSHWLDQPGNVRKILWVLGVIGALLFAADAFYEKHAHFPAEEFFGFYAIVGFGAFVGIVLAGKYLRKILMRPEDYYDD
jgi:hypothetical protein